MTRAKNLRFIVAAVLIAALALPVSALAIPGLGPTENAAQAQYLRNAGVPLGGGDEAGPGDAVETLGDQAGGAAPAGLPAGSSGPQQLPFTGFLVGGLLVLGASLLVGGAAFRRSLAH